MTEEKMFNYITSMWYESKCKDKKQIRRIITEEIENNPKMEYNKLSLKALRRCMSEL